MFFKTFLLCSEERAKLSAPVERVATGGTGCSLSRYEIRLARLHLPVLTLSSDLTNSFTRLGCTVHSLEQMRCAKGQTNSPLGQTQPFCCGVGAYEADLGALGCMARRRTAGSCTSRTATSSGDTHRMHNVYRVRAWLLLFSVGQREGTVNYDNEDGHARQHRCCYQHVHLGKETKGESEREKESNAMNTNRRGRRAAGPRL